jgi:hypothetical protein
MVRVKTLVVLTLMNLMFAFMLTASVRADSTSCQMLCETNTQARCSCEGSACGCECWGGGNPGCSCWCASGCAGGGDCPPRLSE